MSKIYGSTFLKLFATEPLYVTLFGGTLAETYFLARLIVKWLFAEIPYKSDSEKIMVAF